MAKSTGVSFDVESEVEQPQYIPVNETQEESRQSYQRPAKKSDEKLPLISCLRNEKIIVKYANRPNANITDPKHVLYGGMAENATRKFTIQMLRSGSMPNVLNDSEKAFLEDYMGLEYNALSIYLKKDNYWRGYSVTLTKADTILDLSIPDDYIKYKVLLTNTNAICPSLKEFTDARKVTYQYYMVNEGDEIKQTNKNMSVKMEAMLELGKISENKSVLKLVTETMDGRKIANTSKLEFIQGQAFKAVELNPKLFLTIVKDPYLKTKVLISECFEHGILNTRNGLYYMTSNSEPLCEAGEESTLQVAAKYLNSPKRQEVKLTIEAKLKLKKE